MDRNERKTRKIFIGLATLLSSTLILLILFNLNVFSKYEITNKKYKNLKKELEITKNEKELLEQEKLLAAGKIDDLNNITNLIQETKTQVFELAKKLESKITNGENKYKIAYITFDDGPYYLTNSYLRTLRDNHVKATFFTIGLDKEWCYDNRNMYCYDMYEKIAKDNHTLANHTYSHLIRRGLYSSVSSFITQIRAQENLIKTKTGITTNITRFPGGSGTAGGLKNGIIEELRKNHYGWVDWTALDGDGGGYVSYSTAWNNFINSINEDIEVILFHDYSETTLAMLPNAIKYLRDNNYILLPLFYDSVKINK